MSPTAFAWSDSIRILHALLTPFGVLGLLVAACGATIFAVTVWRGSAEAAGFAACAWLVGTVQSLATGFEAEWTPSIVAAASFPILGVAAALLRRVRPPRPARVSQ